MALGPAPPLQGEPEKLPWQKSNVHEPRYGSLPLVLAQARRDEAKTWVLYSTNIGYPSIIIWGPGPLGWPRAHKKFAVCVARAKCGRPPTLIFFSKAAKRELTAGTANRRPTSPWVMAKRAWAPLSSSS